MSKREKDLENLLARFLEPIKNIPFEILIKSWYGTEVLDFNIQRQKMDFIKLLAAMRSVCYYHRDSPITSSRPNEVGNKIEVTIKDYPDLLVRGDTGLIYLEVKTFDADTEKSSFRTFYFSPSKNPRVTEDAYHLLVGFSMQKIDADQFLPTGFYLVNVYGLKCDIKFEANSNNKLIYSDEHILHRERLS